MNKLKYTMAEEYERINVQINKYLDESSDDNYYISTAPLIKY